MSQPQKEGGREGGREGGVYVQSLGQRILGFRRLSRPQPNCETLPSRFYHSCSECLGQKNNRDGTQGSGNGEGGLGGGVDAGAFLVGGWEECHLGGKEGGKEGGYGINAVL